MKILLLLVARPDPHIYILKNLTRVSWVSGKTNEYQIININTLGVVSQKISNLIS